MQPLSRPAVTAHSPNRKPRWRSKKTQVRTRDTLRVKGERVIQAVAVGKTKAEAIELADTSRHGMEILERIDPDFTTRLQQAEVEAAIHRAEAAGYLDSELLAIAKEWRKIGKTAEDVRLRADVDWKQLKGRGVLVGDGVQVAVQVNQPPQIINLLPAEPGKPFREITETGTK